MNNSVQTKIHNELAGQVVRQIITTPLEAGGKMSDALVLTESILFGVLLYAKACGYDIDKVLPALVDNVKDRIAREKLKSTLPQGTA